MLSRVAVGRLAETVAAGYLELRGFTVLDRNYRFGPLELDLVARKDRLLVIAEVKYRAGKRYGGARGAVGRDKRRALETAAVAWRKHRGVRGVTVRFDVIVVEEESQGLRVVHLPGAFEATGRYRW
jgi:putative endonuclease